MISPTVGPILGFTTSRHARIFVRGEADNNGAVFAGMVDAMRSLPAHRKVLVHINNSNPILDETSAQRQALTAHAIEVAYDGMEITL